MRSYRESVAQDADFVDGIPEAGAWLGFPTRRNPLFLPPKGRKFSDEPSFKNVGLDGVDLARLWNAQEFILLDHDAASENSGKAENTRGGGANSGNVQPKRGGDRAEGIDATAGTNRFSHLQFKLRATTREKISAIASQLATTQESIRDLEGSLRSLEVERETGRARAARARKAAEEAGQQKQMQKMYRLRGAAGVLEGEMASLSAEITAVRVRLFAERQVCVDVHPLLVAFSCPTLLRLSVSK